MMRFAFATLCFLTTWSNCFAQDGYFICIQSDNNQGFYTRIGEKTWASSAVGNLVIPGLKDSTYRVSVGFPRGIYPEQVFVVIFNRKDLGFQLKKEEGQRWKLVNWQTQEVLNHSTDQFPPELSLFGEKKKDEGFTNLMAAVVNDTAVLYTTLVRAVPVKPEPAPVVATTLPAKDSTVAVVKQEPVTVLQPPVNKTTLDSTAIAGTTTNPADPANAIPADTTQLRPATDSTGAITITDKPLFKPAAGKANIALVAEKTAAEGRKFTYVDSGATGVDTISIVIDFEMDSVMPAVAKTNGKENITDTPVGNKPSDTVATTKPEKAVVVTKPVATPTDTAFIKPAQVPEKKDTIVSNGVGEFGKKPLVLINSDCINFATDYDVDKLRIRILAETNLDGRLAASRKVFKTRCFTTKQFRGLSELFLNDEEKFRFFELGYPFAADTSNFRTLIDLFTDPGYISRFKSLVRMPAD